MRLISYDNPLPGGYYFSQDGHTWKGPTIESVAQPLLAYRSANGKPRATYKECVIDVDCYQCQRLGNNPRFCTGQSEGVISMASNAPGLEPCKGCGARIE